LDIYFLYLDSMKLYNGEELLKLRKERASKTGMQILLEKLEDIRKSDPTYNPQPYVSKSTDQF
jgi:hypothetical protein